MSNEIMGKESWCKCAEALRKYSNWERGMYNWGIDFAHTPVNGLADTLYNTLCGFNDEWDYDPVEGISWIIEWCFEESPLLHFTRCGREWHLTTPENLYDFLVFMNQEGWEDV